MLRREEKGRKGSVHVISCLIVLHFVEQHFVVILSFSKMDELMW